MQGPQRAIGVGWQVAVRSRCVRGSSDERVESVSFAHHPVCETGGTQVTASSLIPPGAAGYSMYNRHAD